MTTANQDAIAGRLRDQESTALKRRDGAAKAQQALNSGVIDKAFDELREVFREAIEEAPLATNVDALRQALNILGKVRQLIHKQIEDGKVAERDLAHIGRERSKLGLTLDRLRRVA